MNRFEEIIALYNQFLSKCHGYQNVAAELTVAYYLSLVIDHLDGQWGVQRG